MVQSSTGFISSIKVEEVKVLFKGSLLAEQVVPAHQMNKSQKGKGQSRNSKGSREFRVCVRNQKKHEDDTGEEAIRGGSARTKIGSEGKEQRRKSRRRCPKTTVKAGKASVAYKTCG